MGMSSLDAETQGKKTKKLRECIKCEHFFDCKGVAVHVVRCLYFRERKAGRK